MSSISCNMLRNVIKSHVSHRFGQLIGVRLLSDGTAAEPTRVEKTLNQVTLLGRVGAEPTKRGSEDHPVVIFSLATHTQYKYDTGDLMQRTEWHRVCVFNPNLRQIVYEYLKKGQRTLVKGRLSYGEVKDNEGKYKLVASIIADDVIFFNN